MALIANSVCFQLTSLFSMREPISICPQNSSKEFPVGLSQTQKVQSRNYNLFLKPGTSSDILNLSPSSQNPSVVSWSHMEWSSYTPWSPPWPGPSQPPPLLGLSSTRPCCSLLSPFCVIVLFLCSKLESLPLCQFNEHLLNFQDSVHVLPTLQPSKSLDTRKKEG